MHPRETQDLRGRTETEITPVKDSHTRVKTEQLLTQLSVGGQGQLKEKRVEGALGQVDFGLIKRRFPPEGEPLLHRCCSGSGGGGAGIGNSWTAHCAGAPGRARVHAAAGAGAATTLVHCIILRLHTAR